MFKFLGKEKKLPEVPEDKQQIAEEVMRVTSDMRSQEEVKEKKMQEEREKMRPEVREMYKKIIEEAKAKGDTKKQKIYESALQELEKQISKDEEKKEE
jgi:DNA-binding ferritin-like protein